jgi:hypothetical protein
MEIFLPHYINVDLPLPKTYHYEFGLFFDLLQWTFDWKNIKYQTADLDIKDVSLEIKQNADKNLISFKFPALKHWEIDAHQTVNNWILPDESDV